MNKFDQVTERKYVITGTLRNGRRFKPIYTNIPQHYNIYHGTIWKLVEGEDGLKHRKKMVEIWN